MRMRTSGVVIYHMRGILSRKNSAIKPLPVHVVKWGEGSNGALHIMKEVQMKRFIALAICGLLFMAPGQLIAQLVEEDDPLDAIPQQPLIERLKLSDQQKKQVEQMRIEMEKQMVDVRSRVQKAALDLRQLQSAENLDKAAMEKKIGEIAQLRGQMASMRLNHWFEVNKLLNADQQKVWREVLKHPLRERLREFRGRRMQHDLRPFMGGRMGRGMHSPEMRERIRERIREFIGPGPEKK